MRFVFTTILIGLLAIQSQSVSAITPPETDNILQYHTFNQLQRQYEKTNIQLSALMKQMENGSCVEKTRQAAQNGNISSEQFALQRQAIESKLFMLRKQIEQSRQKLISN